MKNNLLFLMLIGFILGTISISSGGDRPGVKVYSGAGNHETGDFIPASDGEVIIISQPEVQEKPITKQDSEKMPEQKIIEVKNTIIINENKKENQNYLLPYPYPYRRHKRPSKRPKVEHYSK
jgi:hypothetical protein